MSTETSTPRHTYGNVVPVVSPGVFGLSLLGSVLAGVSVMATFLALVAIGWKTAVGALIVTGVPFVALGTPVGTFLGVRLISRIARQKRSNQWRSGMFSRSKDPAMRLPGLMGKTRLLSKVDPFGDSFAVLHHPSKDLFTFVARCEADGPALQDRATLNNWVADWSGVLGALGHEGAVVCSKAITDTAPDTGGRLQASVQATRSPNAPALASRIIDECVASYPAAAAENVTYIEVTFKGRALNRKSAPEKVMSEMARRVPELIKRLEAAGGGAVEMMSARDLARVVRVAYDPDVQTAMESDELRGSTREVSWASAGPVADCAYWDRYLHDSGESVTFEMVRPPQSTITELSLSGVLAPHADFRRKRVAIIHRPHGPEQSAKTSEQDLDTATFATQQSKRRTSARATKIINAAEKARQEVADGAVLTRLSLMVTTTVPATGGDLDQAVSTMLSQAGGMNLTLRRCYGSQAAAFAATLPVGLVPWEETVIPDKIRKFA